MIHPKPKPVREKKQKKRKQKSAKQLLEIKADRLVREIVILRDGFCVCAPPAKGHSETLQPGHLITRAKKSVRWDLRNTNCQCASCNLLHEFYAEIYTRWFIGEFGTDCYIKLVEDAGHIEKIGTDTMQTLCDELEKILAHLKENKDWKPRFKQSEIISGLWTTGEKENGGTIQS